MSTTAVASRKPREQSPPFGTSPDDQAVEPIVLPQPKRGPTREPGWAFFGRGVEPVEPASILDHDAADTIRETVGKEKLVAILEDGVNESLRRLEALHASIAAGHDNFAVMQTFAARYENHRRWLMHLRYAKNPTRPKKSPPPPIDRMSILGFAFSQSNEAYRKRLAIARNIARVKVAEVDSELDRLKGIVANDDAFILECVPPGDRQQAMLEAVKLAGFTIPTKDFAGFARPTPHDPRGSYDNVHDQIAMWLNRQKEAVARLKGIDEVEVEIENGVKKIITAAVNTQGSPEAAVEAVLNAMMKDGQWPLELAAAKAEFDKAGAALDDAKDVDQTRRRLHIIDGEKEAAAAIDKGESDYHDARAKLVAAARDYAGAIVNKALAGDDGASVYVQRLAETHPGEFKTGRKISDRLKEAHFDRSAIELFHTELAIK